MTIQFKKSELKAYPLLPKVEVGLDVLATYQTYYSGLYGVITEIRYGDQKETENDTILEIIVDFEEPAHSTLAKTNPELNGTSINQVIMSEEELSFSFQEGELSKHELFFFGDGRAVCLVCKHPMDKVTETQQEKITWTFVNGEYQKENDIGLTFEKRCEHCKDTIVDSTEFFGY